MIKRSFPHTKPYCAYKLSFRADDRTLTDDEVNAAFAKIAEALKANGVMIHRYTAKKHTPRGMFCAIGRCTACVMVVDGEPNVRTCMTPLKEGMVVQTQYGNSAKPFEEQAVQK